MLTVLVVVMMMRCDACWAADGRAGKSKREISEKVLGKCSSEQQQKEPVPLSVSVRSAAEKCPARISCCHVSCVSDACPVLVRAVEREQEINLSDSVRALDLCKTTITLECERLALVLWDSGV